MILFLVILLVGLSLANGEDCRKEFSNAGSTFRQQCVSSEGVDYLSKPRRDNYDYIVVGAGSAGAALANRLSEDRNSTILLLEAGGPPPDMSEIPLFVPYLANTSIEWNNLTEPQKKACLGSPQKRCKWSRAKTLGGCSSHNYMCFVRGNKHDFDNWEELGAKGWNYKSVLQTFKKMENHEDPVLREDADYHGTTGYQSVSSIIYNTKIGDAYLEAGKSLGYKVVDYNAATQYGVSRLQSIQRNGQRCSTEKAYLRSAVHRENLDIVPNAFVLKVNFDDKKKVKEVVFDHANMTKKIRVNKEVILSAGTLSSPKILMLSGVGPADHLKEMKIPLIEDVPGVGQNLQDHMVIAHLNYFLNDSVGIVYNRDVTRENIGKLANGKGPLTSPGHEEVLGFINTKYQKPEEDWPDVQFIGGSGPILLPWPMDFTNRNSTGILAYILRPKSRGVVKLKSTDPYMDPSVDPRYFSDEGDDDIKRTIDAVRLCEDIMASPAIQRYNPILTPDVLPGCENLTQGTDQYRECAITYWGLAGLHFAGTCRMGDPKDKTTVVDPELRVLGVTGLRVADASIMPLITSGNLNAPCIMIGERAAELIKKGSSEKTNA